MVQFYRMKYNNYHGFISTSTGSGLFFPSKNNYENYYRVLYKKRLKTYK